MTKAFPIIDTHVHLWDINRLDYAWLDKVPSIKKSFFIEDYQQATVSFFIEKLVFVQSECLPEQCLKEVDFVMEQAVKDKRIQGIVAYAALEKGKAVTNILDKYRKNGLIKGVRRIYDEEPSICYSTRFLDALNILPSYNLSFDVSIQPHSIAATFQMINDCPNTFFILDHLGKPDIRRNALSAFKKNIDMLAAFPNVTAKISGLITEAEWNQWTKSDIEDYINHAINTFGFGRLLFGGDWPVVLLAGSYKQWLETLIEVLQPFKHEDVLQLFYKNAQIVYKL